MFLCQVCKDKFAVYDAPTKYGPKALLCENCAKEHCDMNIDYDDYLIKDQKNDLRRNVENSNQRYL